MGYRLVNGEVEGARLMVSRGSLPNLGKVKAMVYYHLINGLVRKLHSCFSSVCFQFKTGIAHRLRRSCLGEIVRSRKVETNENDPRMISI